MAALRVRSPKFFAWLLWVRRVWYSFGKVRLGILYLLVNRTSSSLTPEGLMKFALQ